MSNQQNIERENDPPETKAQMRARQGIVDRNPLGDDEDSEDIKALKERSKQLNEAPPREAFKDQGNDPQYAFEHEVPKDIHGGDDNVPESINEPPGSDVIPPQSKEAMKKAERDLEKQAQAAATQTDMAPQQPGSEQEVADQRKKREQEQAQAQERSRGGRYVEDDDDDEDDEKGGKKGKKR